MKTGYFCLSAKARNKLFVVIKVLSVVSTLLSAFYLGVVLHSLYRHRFLLHVLIISLFDYMYRNIIALGILLFLLSVVSAKLNMNLKKQPTNHSLPRSHRIWVSLLLLTLLATVMCDVLMTRTKAVVDAEVGPRLKHGLSHYMNTLSWGSALDRVQTYLQCCGVDGPADWYATTWIPMDRLSDHNVDYKLVQPNGRVQVPLVPSSCCRVAGSECGHKAWMETKTRSWKDIKPADVSLLHTVGCEKAIKATIARDIYIIKIILLMVFVVQVVLVVMSRLLFSSTINSVMLGRPQEKAPGWILGPRLFRTKNRHGYLQEYDDKCQNTENKIETENSTIHKKKWKCIKGICKKSGKETESEGTESSEVRRRFKSRLKNLKKLKSPCIEKVKASCSRKLRKKKQTEGEYTALELESDASLEGEGERKNRVTSLNREGKSIRGKINVPSRKGSPNSRGGKEELQFQVHTGIKNRPFEEQHQHFKVLEAGVNSVSPFSAKYGDLKPLTVQTSGSKSPTHYKTVNLEPKRHASRVVNDFKKRRELFENGTTMKRQTDHRKVDKVQRTSTPSDIRPLSIDLGDIESARSLSIGKRTSGTDVTTLSSAGHDGDASFGFRNYPYLSPSE